MKKYILLFVIANFALIFGTSCAGDHGSADQEKGVVNNPGLKVFKTYCVTCHGDDGKLGLSGAADLSASTLSKDEAVNVITNGRKVMAPYKSVLSPEQIDQVADHILTLRK